MEMGFLLAMERKVALSCPEASRLKERQLHGGRVCNMQFNDLGKTQGELKLEGRAFCPFFSFEGERWIEGDF